MPYYPIHHPSAQCSWLRWRILHDAIRGRQGCSRRRLAPASAPKGGRASKPPPAGLGHCARPRRHPGYSDADDSATARAGHGRHGRRLGHLAHLVGLGGVRAVPVLAPDRLSRRHALEVLLPAAFARHRATGQFVKVAPGRARAPGRGLGLRDEHGLAAHLGAPRGARAGTASGRDRPAWQVALQPPWGPFTVPPASPAPVVDLQFFLGPGARPCCRETGQPRLCRRLRRRDTDGAMTEVQDLAATAREGTF